MDSSCAIMPNHHHNRRPHWRCCYRERHCRICSIRKCFYSSGAPTLDVLAGRAVSHSNIAGIGHENDDLALWPAAQFTYADGAALDADFHVLEFTLDDIVASLQARASSSGLVDSQCLDLSILGMPAPLMTPLAFSAPLVLDF
jgi:hypothetical protein